MAGHVTMAAFDNDSLQSDFATLWQDDTLADVFLLVEVLCFCVDGLFEQACPTCQMYRSEGRALMVTCCIVVTCCITASSCWLANTRVPQGERLAAHRCVLSARSPLLRSVFKARSTSIIVPGGPEPRQHCTAFSACSKEHDFDADPSEISVLACSVCAAQSSKIWHHAYNMTSGDCRSLRQYTSGDCRSLQW